MQQRSQSWRAADGLRGGESPDDNSLCIAVTTTTTTNHKKRKMMSHHRGDKYHHTKTGTAFFSFLKTIRYRERFQKSKNALNIGDFPVNPEGEKQ